jgi:hypothetical protein
VPRVARGIYVVPNAIGTGAIVLRAYDSAGEAIAEVRVRDERELYEQAATFLRARLDARDAVAAVDTRRRELMRLVR